jgi:hypothetical protein
MIAKLVKAGYLRPEHLQDADAITSAIASMKRALYDLAAHGPEPTDAIVELGFRH